MKSSGMSFCFESRATESTVTRNDSVISAEPEKWKQRPPPARVVHLVAAAISRGASSTGSAGKAATLPAGSQSFRHTIGSA